MTFSDDFNRADGALGADYVVNGDLAIVSNEVQGTGTLGIAWYVNALPDDQVARITLGTVAPDGLKPQWGLFVRSDVQDFAPAACYGASLYWNDPDWLFLVFSQTGSFGVFDQALGAVPAPGDTFELSAIGDTITCKLNDTVLYTTTDTDVPSGPYASFALQQSTTVEGGVDRFEIGPFPAGTPTGEYPYGGRDAYRETPYRGDFLDTGGMSRGIPFLDGNDRSQVVLVSRDGRAGGIPEFRVWVAQPPQWAELIGGADRRTILQTYAWNEDDNPTVGRLQLAAIAVGAGQEANISGVRVEFAPRPTAVNVGDGGVDPDELVGFDVYVEGFGLPRQIMDTSVDPRKTGVLRSETQQFRITAKEVSTDFWPAVFTGFFPCRLGPLRDFQPHIVNLRHCEIRAVEVIGSTLTSRLT